MIEETAKVVAIDGNYAIVQAERKSACGACNAATSCGTSVIDKLFSGRASRMRVWRDGHDVTEGEIVVIGIEESRMLHAAFIVYMLPLLAMFLSAMIGSWLYRDAAGADLVSVLFAAIGLLAGFGIARAYSNRPSQKSIFQAVIVRGNAALSSSIVSSKFANKWN